jgi:hypothetical protein
MAHPMQHYGERNKKPTTTSGVYEIDFTGQEDIYADPIFNMMLAGIIRRVDYPVYVLDQSTDYTREYLSPTRCEISGFFDEVGEETT